MREELIERIVELIRKMDIRKLEIILSVARNILYTKV